MTNLEKKVEDLVDVFEKELKQTGRFEDWQKDNKQVKELNHFVGRAILAMCFSNEVYLAREKNCDGRAYQYILSFERPAPIKEDRGVRWQYSSEKSIIARITAYDANMNQGHDIYQLASRLGGVFQHDMQMLETSEAGRDYIRCPELIRLHRPKAD